LEASTGDRHRGPARSGAVVGFDLADGWGRDPSASEAEVGTGSYRCGFAKSTHDNRHVADVSWAPFAVTELSLLTASPRHDHAVAQSEAVFAATGDGRRSGEPGHGYRHPAAGGAFTGFGARGAARAELTVDVEAPVDDGAIGEQCHTVS